MLFLLPVPAPTEPGFPFKPTAKLGCKQMRWLIPPRLESQLQQGFLPSQPCCTGQRAKCHEGEATALSLRLALSLPCSLPAQHTWGRGPEGSSCPLNAPSPPSRIVQETSQLFPQHSSAMALTTSGELTDARERADGHDCAYN